MTLEAYLRPSPAIDFDHPSIRAFLEDAGWTRIDPWEGATQAYQFVRDEVAHSYDAQNPRSTFSASDALLHRTGLCYSKSHLLAAFLRGLGIPAAIRYQRLTLTDDVEDGFCLHGFNSVWLDGGWLDLDARGNNARVRAEFSLGTSILAFEPRVGKGESTLPAYFAEPVSSVVCALKVAKDALTMALPDLSPGDAETEREFLWNRF